MRKLANHQCFLVKEKIVKAKNNAGEAFNKTESSAKAHSCYKGGITSYIFSKSPT